MTANDPKSPNEAGYWFPAKRYGWAWGFPCRIEGWLVFLGYFAVLCAASVFVAPHESMLGFLGIVLAATLALLAVCKAKGEPPRWRWGDED